MKDRLIGTGVPFTHIARITGYLATTARFNYAKHCELNDRVKHTTTNQPLLMQKPHNKV